MDVQVPGRCISCEVNTWADIVRGDMVPLQGVCCAERRQECMGVKLRTVTAGMNCPVLVLIFVSPLKWLCRSVPSFKDDFLLLGEGILLHYFLVKWAFRV